MNNGWNSSKISTSNGDECETRSSDGVRERVARTLDKQYSKSMQYLG